MRNGLVALALAVAAATLVIVVLRLVGLEQAHAAQIATGSFASVPFLYQQLEKATVRSSAVAIPRLDTYSIHSALLIVFGGLAIWAMASLVSAMIGFVMAVENMPLHTMASLNTIQYVVIVPAVFLVGRWIGRRSRTRSALVVLAAVAVYRLGETTLQIWLIPPDELAAMTQMGQMSLARMAAYQALATALLAVPGEIGVWRGRRSRVQAYLAYLAGLLPAETRKDLVDLAYAEVSRAMATKARVIPAVPETPSMANR